MIDPQQVLTSSQLPSLPTAAVKLLELSGERKIDIDKVIEVIKSDPALTIRVLKATNSSFFGFRSEITSIDRGVPLLGTSVAVSLALGFSLIHDSIGEGPLSEHYQSYWMQSIVHAAAAEVLSEITSTGDPSEGFQAGLLLDIGQLAMLATIGEQYVPVREKAQHESLELFAVERDAFGFDHCEIGSRLADKWGLPESLKTYISNHHASNTKLTEFEGRPEFDILKIATVAAAVGEYFCCADKGRALGQMRILTGDFFEFDEDDLDAYLVEVGVRVDTSGQTFNVSTSALPSPEELLAAANSQLSEMALRAQMETAHANERQKEVEQEKELLNFENQQLQQKVFHDPLTKLYNRQFLKEALGREVLRCRRVGAPVAVLFIDVDHFKAFNDTYGHLFGDHVLQQTAALLQRTIRDCDTAARFGGEEFVVLMQQPSMDGLATMAERVRSAIEAEVVEIEGNKVSVTASVGGALGLPAASDDNFEDSILAAADEAMYEAKQNGRNQTRVRDLSECGVPAPTTFTATAAVETQGAPTP